MQGVLEAVGSPSAHVYKGRIVKCGIGGVYRCRNVFEISCVSTAARVVSVFARFDHHRDAGAVQVIQAQILAVCGEGNKEQKRNLLAP